MPLEQQLSAEFPAGNLLPAHPQPACSVWSSAPGTPCLPCNFLKPKWRFTNIYVSLGAMGSVLKLFPAGLHGKSQPGTFLVWFFTSFLEFETPLEESSALCQSLLSLCLPLLPKSWFSCGNNSWDQHRSGLHLSPLVSPVMFETAVAFPKAIFIFLHGLDHYNECSWLVFGNLGSGFDLL